MSKIANIENEICSVETLSQHRELYHYTKACGVRGYYRVIDVVVLALSRDADEDEVRFMRGLLPPAVAPR